MIPVRNTIPSQNYPVVNNVIIAVNILFFLLQMTMGSGIDRFFYVYGLVPARYSVPHVSSYFSLWQQVISFFTFMFIHGGFWHLLGNMWSLYIFGNNVEDRLGHLRYLIFYLLCGLASGLAHLLLNLNSNVPTLGASGAIAGVMGAFFLLYPWSRILTLIPIIFIPWFVEIPAFFFLGIWFLIQMLNAAGVDGGSGGIAWWAHIGGFVAGMVFLKLFQAFPGVGAVDAVSRITKRKKTDRLQVIRPVSQGESHHLYAQIGISFYESLTGTRKMVNIPWGFHKRLFRVSIPAGVKEGSVLRLKGLGQIMPDGARGDLYLRVLVNPQGPKGCG